jgi:nitroreductase/NAD-dependent dihydropyrimidine dehydrogenase PreA subunit
MKPIAIDYSKCTLCNLCLQQCSNDKIVIKENKITISECGDDTCTACGHCYAVCPMSAIIPENRKAPEKVNVLPMSSENMLYMLRARRSHRSYKSTPVDDLVLNKIADFGRYAPTGTNSESVQYLFVKDKTVKNEILKESMLIYKKLYNLLNNPFVKYFGQIFYKRQNLKQVRASLFKMMEEYNAGGDPIFFNAPVIAFIFTDRNMASTPYDDCCYATYNMILGAESIGVSSCINARATAGVFHSRKLKKMLGFIGNIKMYTCVNLGYPKYAYNNLVFRKKPIVTIL